MTAHGPDHPIGTSMDEADGEAERARRLDALQRRSRQLERQRIAAGSSLDHARLVALDVELCRVEAIRRMLAPSSCAVAPSPFPHGAPSREPMRSPAEPLEAWRTRDVLGEDPGAALRCDERMARDRPSWTSRLVLR